MASVENVKKIGLYSCIAIVAGNMMGSGIALLPANLAKIGSIAIYGWLFASAGALALAFVYAKLGTKDPQVGGPIAYASEVAPIFGYQAGLLYFHAGWIGNLAIAITGVDYLSVFFPILTQPIPAGIATLVAVWSLTGLNLLGASWIGKLATAGVALLLIPVVLTGAVGWFFFEKAYFIQNWNVSGGSDSQAIMAAIVLCIWSFIGVESASVNAGLVENPKRNIPLATLIGTSLAALVYITSSTAITGMFPASVMAASGAPFSLACSHMFGAWASPVVSAVTAFACLASLGSWIMMIAQAARRASSDGSLPKIFGELNEKGIPVKAMLMTSSFVTVLMLALMLLSGGRSTQELFGEIASITVLLTVIPYFYSALQLLKLGYLVPKKAILQIVASLLAIVFCFSALAGADHSTLVVAILVMLITLVFYVLKDRTSFEEKARALRHSKNAQMKEEI